MTVTAVIKYSEWKKRKAASEDTNENQEALQLGEDLLAFEIICHSHCLLHAELKNKPDQH